MAEILADMKLMLKQYRFKEGTLCWRHVNLGGDADHVARWVAQASEQQVNLGVGFSPAWDECHPQVTNIAIGGNAGPEGGAHVHGPVGECAWVAVLVGVEQPAHGRAGIMCGDLHQKNLQYLMEQQGLNCPYLTKDPLSMLPSDPRRVQYMVDYFKLRELQTAQPKKNVQSSDQVCALVL